MDGLERAKAALEAGRPREARDRLKGLVVTYPRDQEVRSLLAEAYRRDQQWPEAGRWGYLVGSAATDRERRAFETHSAFGWYPRITEPRLQRLLRVDDLATVADDSGRALLRELPRRSNPLRSDGVFARFSRLLATRRARQRWR